MDSAESLHSYRASQVPSLRGRPPLPLGPRTRNHSLQNQAESGSTLLSRSSISSSFSSHSRLASRSSLVEEVLTPDSIPPSYTSPVIPILSPSPKYPLIPPTVDVGVQANTTPRLTPSPEEKPVVKSFPKPVALIPPSPINFDVVPIPFKGLPLEAAQWTFSSPELQDIVSRAIRLSARESFIRVLPIETLDKGVIDEAERLETLKITTQSKYRFQVHRRTMLLQAINSSALATPNDPSVICSLVNQLSETTQTCDHLMTELLQIADQQAQLAKVQDLHWASALAIALRKINKSYGRRTSELKEARERIEMLNAELEEAWKVAEKMAQEVDDLEATLTDDESDESENMTTHTAHVVGVTGIAIATQATLMAPLEASPPKSDPSRNPTESTETESIILRHNRSRRNSRSDLSSRWNQVVAAKTRSQRTSNASLRVTKRNRSVAGRGPEDNLQPPPVPMLPDRQGLSFLDLNPRAESEYSTHPFGSPEAVPSMLVSADTSNSHAEERDSIQSMYPFPLRVRHDSGRRSSSEYNNVKLWQGRHSVPVPTSSASATGPGISLISETP